MNPQVQDRQLDELYAELPDFECQGKCAEICQTTLSMSRRERARMKRVHGEPVRARFPSGWCSMYEDGRCKAHAIRPMICRLWGIAEDMRCPHGCKPSRYLSFQEAAEFLKRADQIGGKGDHVEELRPPKVNLPAYGTIARSSH